MIDTIRRMSYASPNIPSMSAAPTVSCNEVHNAGPCAAAGPVAAVVILRPGQRVSRLRSPVNPEVARMVAGLATCLEQKGHHE